MNCAVKAGLLTLLSRVDHWGGDSLRDRFHFSDQSHVNEPPSISGTLNSTLIDADPIERLSQTAAFCNSAVGARKSPLGNSL